MTDEEIRAIAIQVACSMPNASTHNLMDNAQFVFDYIKGDK